MIDKYKYTRTEYITCPFCGRVETDSWEIDFGPCMEGETEVECGNEHCAQLFIVAREVSVTYSAVLPEAGETIPTPNLQGWGEEDGFTKEER